MWEIVKPRIWKIIQNKVKKLEKNIEKNIEKKKVKINSISIKTYSNTKGKKN